MLCFLHLIITNHLSDFLGLFLYKITDKIRYHSLCLLQVGFEEEMKQIIRLVPVKRQSMLFSATQTRNVEDLARISLQQAPLYVGVDDEEEKSTVEGLEQVRTRDRL